MRAAGAREPSDKSNASGTPSTRLFTSFEVLKLHPQTQNWRLTL